jgi:hypothetical protein
MRSVRAPLGLGNMALAVGLVLLLVSVRPLFLIAREILLIVGVGTTYSLAIPPGDQPGLPVNALRAELNGHVVELTDSEPTSADPTLRTKGPVRIVVDGRDYSSAAAVDIRPAFRDANRYWGYLYLTKLLDKWTRREEIVVAQNLGLRRYRVLRMDASGLVVEDVFDERQRCSPPVRTLLIGHVVPQPIGFCSNIMQSYPTVWFPMLYPMASGTIGIVLTVAGIRRRFREFAEIRRGVE